MSKKPSNSGIKFSPRKTRSMTKSSRTNELSPSLDNPVYSQSEDSNRVIPEAIGPANEADRAGPSRFPIPDMWWESNVGLSTGWSISTTVELSYHIFKLNFTHFQKLCDQPHLKTWLLMQLLHPQGFPLTLVDFLPKALPLSLLNASPRDLKLQNSLGLDQASV
ncbi:hypothetical protein ACHQM5_006774 [Ranunculus cassubicifolius]